ncbi:outer membrane beta-barrel protein [Niabella ginsenosidivorans]|nr:outer membrane beta-barrel protein [Niabella ginsenosidivorans]
MRKFLYVLLFLFHTLFCKAQVSVQGKIQDNTGIPVPDATMEWYGPQQSSQTITTSHDGTFSISALKAGEKYLLQVTAIGYQNSLASLILQKDTTLKLILRPDSITLGNVTVSSRTKLIQVQPDRTIINLADNPTITGSNMADAFNKIPGIQVSNDQLSIPGKGMVQLMQDGRLIQLSQKDLVNYLKSIPVGTISKIEIIANPSAAYDASGNAGLINIITKRNSQQGYSGSVQAGYKQWQHYPGMDITGNISYNSGKWRLYANANMFRIRHRYGFRWEEYYPDRSWIMSDTGDYKQNNLAINAGADYRLSQKSTIGFTVGFSRYFEGGADYVRNHFYNQQGTTDSFLTTYADYVPLARTQSYNVYYQTKLDSTGKSFSLDGSYLTFFRTDECHFTGKTFTPDGTLIPASTARYYNTALQNINIYTLKADVVLPAKIASFQLGGKINFINIYDNLLYYTVKDNERVFDPELSSEYKYTENTQALYANAGRDIRNWSLQAGLRAELTQTTGYSYILSQGRQNNYIKFFPNALISFKKDNHNTFSFTYNKRVRRPTFWNLNPYKSLLTAYSYYEGNPFLQPEYNSNFQLQHSYKNKWTSALFVALTNNGFDDITIARADTNFVLRTPRNFVNSTRLGISENRRFAAFSWWESNNLLNIYYTQGRSQLDYITDMEGWGAYFSSSNSFYLNNSKTLAADANFWYQFPDVALVNRSDAYWNLDLGITTALIKEKLSINASVQDVFGTSAPSYTTFVNGIRQKYATLQLNRNYSLTFIFKFGKKETTASEHSSSNQEEKERI